MVIDNLLGTDALMSSQPSNATAYISDTAISGSGLDDLTVSAENRMSIFAELSNDTHSNASAMFSSSAGYAMGFALTSNLIHSNAQAYIANDGSADAIDAGGDLQVKATNSAQITSDTRLESISNSSGNDAGISLVDKIVEDFAADYDYSSKAGTITLQNGDLVRVASIIRPAVLR